MLLFVYYIYLPHFLFFSTSHKDNSMDVVHCQKQTDVKNTQNVIFPKHYKKYSIECIDIVQHLDFCLGNVIKYLYRAGYKDNALDDLKKAGFYLHRSRMNGVYIQDYPDAYRLVWMLKKDIARNVANYNDEKPNHFCHKLGQFSSYFYNNVLPLDLINVTYLQFKIDGCEFNKNNNLDRITTNLIQFLQDNMAVYIEFLKESLLMLMIKTTNNEQEIWVNLDTIDSLLKDFYQLHDLVMNFDASRFHKDD